MTNLRCQDVTLVRSDAGRGQRTILDAVSCTFEAGTVGLLTGATGAGKSSLIHLLAGLLRPTSGEVYAGQDPVSRWVAGHRDRWRRDVGVALQAASLVDELSVLENVMLPLIPKLSRLKDARSKAEAALEAFDVQGLAAAAVGALSGGQRQRVGLARAIGGTPKYLLVDEPTAHQDAAGTEVVITQLKVARERGAVVVVSAHDPRLIEARVADSHLHLEDGHLEVRS
jgi:ABC-type lipoprotein export system ATPase subunit